MDMFPVTVIIGNNAVGKSAVLQVIDFLCRSVVEDFSVIINDRQWNVENIKSKLVNSNKKIRFKSEISLMENEKTCKYRWEMDITAYSEKNQMLLARELLVDKETDEILLSYSLQKGGVMMTMDGSVQMPVAFGMGASFLKMIVQQDMVDKRIIKFKNFLMNSVSFEALSPQNMRLSSRGSAKNIGPSGRDLPSFMKQMSKQQKTHFMDKLQQLLNNRIIDVQTQTKGKPGWTQINVMEHYDKKNLIITSKELSDGMLRVLAFVAISEIETNQGIFLLDEIENGINSNYAEKLLEILGQVYKETGHQLVLTTHSTVFLDYVDKDSIVYLYRDEEGRTQAENLFASDEMREQLEYMWPGEVILNLSPQEILEKILKK